MVGQLLGHYRIVEKIGSGGMGEVFRARDERLGRDVAIKLVRPASSENADLLRRFEQEARAAAALNHPNILAIYDVGFEGKTPYIVSELLVGRTLRDRLRHGRIPLPETTDYALQITQGLIAAHERKIVHRDLKPENLFLTEDGRVKILDFGVAKLQVTTENNRSVESLTTVTKSGAVIGTVAYMSPEQLRGKTVDHRSDLFSFGAILYEMLTGFRAFRGETQVDTMTAVLREQPQEESFEQAAIPAGFQEVVKHCLEKEPENRFQSAKDLAFALQTISAGTGIKQAGMRRPKRHSSTLAWAVIAVLTVATVLLAMSAIFRPPATQPSYRRLTSEAGTVYGARFAADGQSIVYAAAWNGKPLRLFSTVGNSLLAQPLSITDANLLSISRGNELAVVANGTRNGQLETIEGVLARVPLAGGAPREILSDVRWADWNAKNELAVVHHVDGQSRLEFPIGNVLFQSGGWISNIRFSPAGDRIAFMHHPALWDNRGTVCVVDLSGHVQTLTPEWENERGLAWRRDGKEIWFSGTEQGTSVNLMAVDLTGRVRMVLDLPMAVTLEDLAPDGRALVSLHTERLEMAYSTLGASQDEDLSWHDWNSARDISTDGKFVLFEDASEAAGPNYAVAIRNVDGSLPVQLGEGSAGSLSVDGKWALSIPLKNSTHLSLLPTGVGQQRSVDVTGVDHVHSGWSRFLPDGNHVIVNADQAGHARCYLVDLTSGKATGVTPEGTICGPVSPDGKAIAGKGQNYSVVLYSLTGAAPRPVKITSKFVPVQWSSDGVYLIGYHMGEFPSHVYKLEIATGNEIMIQELKPGVPAGVVMVGPIIASRDGKRFAYSYNQNLSVLYLVSGLR